LNSKNSKKSN